jgi:hypothetical protein
LPPAPLSGGDGWIDLQSGFDGGVSLGNGAEVVEFVL